MTAARGTNAVAWFYGQSSHGGTRQPIPVIPRPPACIPAAITLVDRCLHRATDAQRADVVVQVLKGRCLNHAIGHVAKLTIADCGGDEDPACTGERFDRCIGEVRL